MLEKREVELVIVPAGVLAIECDVARLHTGDQVTLNLREWTLHDQDGSLIPIEAAPITLLDEYRAGGRLNLIIGRNLTHASDSPENGLAEAALWFKAEELVSWNRAVDPWIFEK